MNKQFKILIFLVFFLFFPVFINSLMAQSPPPTGEEIPLDGGLGFLLAAGVAYAARKLYKHKDLEN